MEETRICKECKLEKPLEKFKHHSCEGSYRQVCGACRARWERIKLKLDVIGHYGAKCNCCGESNIMFLTLDHVADDGNEERQMLACHQIFAKARREGYPPTYQLLCANCNMAKSWYGVCPHNMGNNGP